MSNSKCPSGHTLPHATIDGRECTVLDCASKLKVTQLTTKKQILDLAVDDSAAVQREAKHELRKMEERSALEERSLINKLKTKANLRRQLMNVPPALEGGEAEEYHDKRMASLLPFAAAEIEYQLLYGSDSERARAAERVQDVTGHGKKENGGSTQPLIIINGLDLSKLPWQKNREIVSDTVDALNSGPTDAQE